MRRRPLGRFSSPLRPPEVRWRPGVLAWTLWALNLLGLATAFWLDQLLREAGRPELASFTADAVPYLLALVSAATVGAVVASRRSHHPAGWLLLALGLSVTLLGAGNGYAAYGLLARPGTLPAAGWAAVYQDSSWVVQATPLVVLSYLGAAVTLFAVLVAAASLAVRFRRARGVERQQLRWVAFAGALAGAAVAVVLASWATVGDGAQALWGWATGLYVAALPLAIGAAILRYRLYDLDRIISRTLAYGLLTVLLGLGYGGAVLGLGQLLGRDSPTTVAGATLAVAALFGPARRRVQWVVDRRFDRRRYDAARTIQAFSARLRQEVDLDTLTGELLAVIDQTMQPTRASLWLRPPRRPGGQPGGSPT
jgi:hypothetical protein